MSALRTILAAVKKQSGTITKSTNACLQALNKSLVEQHFSRTLTQSKSTIQNYLCNPTHCVATAPLLQFHRSFHTSRCKAAESSGEWTKYNQIVYTPRKDGEPCRPAVRGMSVDEARKQLTFRNRAGASILKEVIEDAQNIAVQEHNVEYKSNLWIAEVFARRGFSIQGIRKHRGPRIGKVKYQFINIYVKLREGKPPEHYYPPPPTGHEKKAEYINSLRARRITHTL